MSKEEYNKAHKERFGDPKDAEKERPKKGDVLPPPRERPKKSGT